jgi:succinate dehydrogenase/fumarate reductase cytochrome b subunit
MKATTDERENPLVNILFNIVLPAVILAKFSTPERLGPVYGLLVGLAFPLGYGLYDFVRKRKANFFSLLGFFSILLTGSFGLMQLDGIWFAVKEAAVPLLIGLATVVSLKTRYPLVRTLLYNEKVIDVSRVDLELASRGNAAAFDKLLVYTTWLLAASFLLSAILNFGLAVFLLKSPAGSPEFNEELGKMTALSYPVIVLPSMLVTIVALWHLVSGIRKLTGLDLESIFHANEKRP